MTTYAESGVDIHSGDKASKNAYTNAKKTFSSRDGLIGAPYVLDGGFAGVLDMGDHLLIQNDDGVGTKLEIAERTNIFDTIGEDLVAMVADDAICLGAEVLSITNTVDTPKVEPEIIDGMTSGLAKACIQEKIVIPGGEIAELGNALNKMVWNATSVGVVKKEKLITGNTITSGQVIIGLKGRVLRSNGMSLARKICEKNFGADWHTAEWKDGISWGEVLLTPSKIFHRTLLDTVLGDFNSPRPFPVHGIVHITGGGIPGNIPRILPKGVGATLDDLHSPHQAVQDLVKLGNVAEEEAYRAWHCGTAMVLFVDESDADPLLQAINSTDPEAEAKIVGQTNNSGTISLKSGFSGKNISFSIS